MPQRAALYARVSTERQRDEATIASQVAEIRREIEAAGHLLAEERVYCDEGYSGELLRRPALDRLREEARQGGFDLLYVYDRGRLARKFAYQEVVIDEFQDLGIRFVPLHDAPAESPEERVLQAMQGVFHEYERVKITERLWRGKLYKVQSGRLLGHLAPYGYDYMPKREGAEGAFRPHPVEAETVRAIFRWVAEEGATIREVVRRLQAAGIPPRHGRQETWSTSTVSRILRNETYVGRHHFLKTASVYRREEAEAAAPYRRTRRTGKRPRSRSEWLPVPVPPLLEPELFAQAQARLRQNAQFAQRHAKHEYLLRGLIYCSCGQRRHGSTVNGHHYYLCAEPRNRFPLPRRCDRPPVTGRLVDEAVWEVLAGLLREPDRLSRLAEEWLSRQRAAGAEDVWSERRDALDMALVETRREEERYATAFGRGLLTLETYERLTARVRGEIARLERELAEVGAPARAQEVTSDLTPPALAALAAATLESLATEDRQELVRSLVQQVIADREEIRVVGRIPLPADPERLRSVHQYGGNTILPFEVAVPYVVPRRES